MGTLNLGLEVLRDSKFTKVKSKNGSDMVIAIGNMQNAQYAVDVVSKKVVAVVCRDRDVRNAVASLKQAKVTIKAFGASESIMSLFNAGNQLSDALGLAIPEITSVNASSVGLACCEAIEQKTLSAYSLVNTFFKDLVANVTLFFEKLDDVTTSQKKALEEVASGMLSNLDTIDAVSFANMPIFGFAKTTFDERLNALNGIIELVGNCEATPSCIEEFRPLLEVLGYQVREEAVIEPETVQEAEETAPESSTVLHEEHAPVTSTEDIVEGEDVAPVAEVPADVPQEKTMAVFGWNPATIRDGVNGMCELLGKVGGLRPIQDKILELQQKALAAIDSESTQEEEPAVAPIEEDTPTQEEEPAPVDPEVLSTEALEGEEAIESCRTIAGFFGVALTLFQSNVTEMVNQLVTMVGKLKAVEVEAESPAAVPVEEVTTEAPIGPVAPVTEPVSDTGEIVEPDNVPDTEDVEPDAIDDETLPQPVGGAEHTEEVETPTEDQPDTDLPGEDSEGEKPAGNFWKFGR